MVITCTHLWIQTNFEEAVTVSAFNHHISAKNQFTELWLNSLLGLLYIFECFAVMSLQGMQHFCKIKISFGTRGKREPEQLTLILPFHSKDPISNYPH